MGQFDFLNDKYTKFGIHGMAETLEVFKQLQDEIGDKKARSKVLVPAVKEAMKPVLAAAKGFAPKDTGLLRDTLTIVGRKPTKRDMKSKYVNPTDTVIAIVTTKNIPKKLKDKFKNHHQDLINAYSTSEKGSEARKTAYKNLRKAKRKFYAMEGVPYDGRAVANEYGTAKMSANPFMRIAMETQARNVANKLGEILKNKIEQYRSKTAK